MGNFIQLYNQADLFAGAGRMMGPPRVPGTHQMDPSGNPMMPPPNQNQSYPGMHPYGGGQPFRNQQMPPYGNYQNNPVSIGTGFMAFFIC